MFQRSTTSECGVTQHTTTTIQYERYITDGAKICSRKQRTKYDRRYDEEANRARRRGSVSGKPERHTRENFHTHYDSSPLTFGRHEEPMRNLFCTRNKKIETRRKISQSATICRIFLGGKLARSRSSSSSTQEIHDAAARSLHEREHVTLSTWDHRRALEQRRLLERTGKAHPAITQACLATMSVDALPAACRPLFDSMAILSSRSLPATPSQRRVPDNQ